MPWFPDFVGAVELARRQTRAAGQADPVGQYFAALNQGDAHTLETVWPGQVVIYDPRAGEVRGHRQVRQFVERNLFWLAGLDAGDVDAVVHTFAPDGYFRGPFGPDHAHRGAAELRSFYTRCFSAGGGIGLQHCMVTDDGVRCALNTTASAGAATTCRRRRDWGSTSAGRTGCWPRSASTTMSRRPGSF